jgi:hypothetical protein
MHILVLFTGQGGELCRCNRHVEFPSQNNLAGFEGAFRKQTGPVNPGRLHSYVIAAVVSCHAFPVVELFKVSACADRQPVDTFGNVLRGDRIPERHYQENADQ